MKSKNTEAVTFKTGRSVLNDYVPANQLLYFDKFNEINQSAYQQDALSQLKNNNLHKNVDRNQSILGTLQLSDFKGKNVKPHIYLNQMRTARKLRLASIDYNDNQSSNMKTTFLNSQKTSSIRLGNEPRHILNKTMVNFNNSQHDVDVQ